MLEHLRNLMSPFKRSEEDGASAVEYGLLVAGIAALIVLIVFAFGGLIKNVFHDTCKTIGDKNAANGGQATPTECN